MEMASLSVYKGILNRTVPKAFYRLLWEAEGGSLGIVSKCVGRFFAVLCMRGYSENLAGCITGTALFDENAFSLAAAAGNCRTSGRNALCSEARFGCDPEGGDSHTQRDPGELCICKGDCGDAAPRMEYRRTCCSARWRTRPLHYENGSVLSLQWMRNVCALPCLYLARPPHPACGLSGQAAPGRSLKGYEIQRKLAIDNTLAFCKGFLQTTACCMGIAVRGNLPRSRRCSTNSIRRDCV